MTPTSRLRALRNGESVETAKVPVVPIADLRASLLQAAKAGHRLCALAPFDAARSGRAGLLAVLADDEGGRLFLAASEPVDRYPALTPDLPEAHLFERELHEEAGIVPEGHPWLKPVRKALADGVSFFREDGEEVHEVGVGPVHAGIIEPGHFRFQCHGETVHHLEIQLGYQHRGVEALLRGGPDRRSLRLAESVCGDTSVGHAWAHCMVREALAGGETSPRADAVRGAALELERLANHIGDLGAISNDIGFLPATAWLGRLRGDFLNMLMALSGNRYGRGLLVPGGVAFDAGPELRESFLATVRSATAELARLGDLLFTRPSVVDRLEETGIVSPRACRDLGLVGPAARASGAYRDVRQDHPHGPFRFRYIPVIKLETGDVYARAMLRWLEAQRSLEFLDGLFREFPEGPLAAPCAEPRPDRVAVALVEGWRGELCHVARTGPDGRFAWYKVVDASFHNWMALAMAMRGGEISDFPLCNKSFNLSYAGHDL